MHLRKHYETEKTVEEINNILRHQPMVGATQLPQSFKQFRGYRVYLGPNANELAAEELAEQQRMAAPEVAPPPRIILHSILIVGYGIRDGVHYYKIKNSHGITWGVQGYGKIQRDLVYRLAYPIGPIEIKVEPEKVASPVTVIKNTKSPRIKRHEGRPKTSKSRMQFGSQGKRFGTEATTKRKHPTHESCKTNAVWGVELKPGKPFTHIFKKSREGFMSLRFTSRVATLSTGSSSMTSIVQCQVGDKKSICLCSLLPGKIEKCPLDLEFEEYHEDVTFLVVGSDNVRLSGFFYGERKDFFGDESGSDPYEEDVVDGARDDSIEFEYDMDDEDKDGSGDDDFSMYPPSRVPNSGGMGLKVVVASYYLLILIGVYTKIAETIVSFYIAG
ncbi:hypothetical protein H5410_053879 [Solanum commersonii]|uniref:peptidylprolyl isomerase n=1 Tax=Solanum commersonii TaxID=4109 RepID=A0A9J5X7M2_SOLCO|nr:hypothetical protein H5410_053879 [Solanum commersonii]